MGKLPLSVRDIHQSVNSHEVLVLLAAIPKQRWTGCCCFFYAIDLDIVHEVRIKLEYSPCIWDPTQTKQMKQPEKVQRRAARFTCNRYHNTSSVTNMPEDLNGLP